MQYIITRPNGSVQAWGRFDIALERFKHILLEDGLPVDGVLRLDEHWVADGRWGAAGALLSRLRYAADNQGVWKLDGSKVPADVAVGETMAAIWAGGQ